MKDKKGGEIMDRECKIVQDLLPAYVEKLTHVETNKLVVHHTRNCADCAEVLAALEQNRLAPDAYPAKLRYRLARRLKRSRAWLRARELFGATGMLVAVFLIIPLVFITIWCFGTGLYPFTPFAVAEQQLTIDSQLNTGNWLVTYNSIHIVSEHEDYYDRSSFLGPKRHFWIIDLELTNVSQESQYAGGAMFSARDDVLTPSRWGEHGEQFISQKIAPGETVQHRQIYLVRVNTRQITLTFRDSLQAGGEVHTVRLKVPRRPD